MNQISEIVHDVRLETTEQGRRRSVRQWHAEESSDAGGAPDFGLRPPGIIILPSEPTPKDLEADIEAAYHLARLATAELKESGLQWRVVAEMTRRLSTVGQNQNLNRTFSRVSLFVRLPTSSGPIVLKRSVIATDRFVRLLESDVISSCRLLLDRSRRLVCAPPIRPQMMSVLLGPEAAAILVHELFGHLLETDNISRHGGLPALLRQGTCRLPNFTLTELSSAQPWWGWQNVDEDGAIQRPVVLIQDGDVVGVIGRANRPGNPFQVAPRARRTDLSRPILPRMTHLSARGTSSVEDVEAEVADGWYIPVFSHGQVDYRSGTAAFDFPEAVPRSAGETGEPHQGARIRLPIPGLLNAIRMMAVDVAETVTLCDKQSQRLPVRHAAPLTALHAVGITEMVAS